MSKIELAYDKKASGQSLLFSGERGPKTSATPYEERMMKKVIAGCLLAGLVGQPAFGQTAQNYQYDGFGRLVRTQRGTDLSTAVTYSYDLADNRVQVKKGRSAPVAVNDYDGFGLYEYGSGIFYYYLPFVLDNDSDADLPADSLTITSISGTGSGYFSIYYGGYPTPFYYVGLNGPPWPPDGSYAITYQVQDQDGQTASAVLYFDMYSCPEYCEGG